MEDRSTVGTVLLTAVAPVAWGSTYAVTQLWLPPDRPLFAAVLRILPAGLLMVSYAVPHLRIPYAEQMPLSGILVPSFFLVFRSVQPDQLQGIDVALEDAADR